MWFMNSLLSRLIIAIACSSILFGCGGGGSGGGGSAVAAAASPERTLATAYSGLETAADLKPENSLTFLARSLEAIEIIPGIGNLLELHNQQHQYSFFRTEEDLLVNASDAITEDQLCDSGSTRVIDELDPNNGLGIVRQLFNNCFLTIDSEQSSNGGSSIAGEIWVNVRRRSATGGVAQHDVELVDLEVVDYRGRRLQINGTIQASPGRLSASIDMHFITESVRIRLENFLYSNNSSMVYQGRVFQSDLGYADLTVEHSVSTEGNTYTVEVRGRDSTGLISTGQDAEDNLGRYIAHYDARYFQDINGQPTNQTLVPQDLLYRRITDSNRQPVATIGDIVSVERLSPAILDASSAVDADADFLFYEWSIQSQPEGCSGTINNADQAVAELIADCVGQFDIALTVSDRITPPSNSTGVATTLNYLAEYSIDVVSQQLLTGDVYQAQVSIANPQDGPFSIRLMSAPEGMTIDNNGSISWDSRFLPLLASATDVHFTVEVSNERAVQQSAVIDVRSNASQLPLVHAALRGAFVAAADLDGDASDEALFIAPDNTLFAVEYSGGTVEHLWSYNIALSNDPEFNDLPFSPFVALADLAGDQRAEIVIAADHVLHVLDSVTKETLFTVDLNQFLPECLIRCSIVYGSMLIADIDADGESEVLVMTVDELENRDQEVAMQMVSMPGGNVTYALSEFEGGINLFNGNPVANLDADANLEILSSTQIWDFVDGTVTPLPSELQSHFNPLNTADLNGDGRHEILQREPGVDGGSNAELIRIDPVSFTELGRITLPTLVDHEGQMFNDHGVRVLGNIDGTPGDEILLFGDHTQRAIIDSVDQTTASVKVEHSTAFYQPDSSAYGDFTGDGAPEALLIPANQTGLPLRLVGSSGVLLTDVSSYAARAYESQKGGSLLAPGIDPNTLFFTAVDLRQSDSTGFDGRIQRLTFDLLTEQFNNLGAPSAFTEPATTFVSSLSRLFGSSNRDLNDDGFKDLILHERRGSFPFPETYWLSVFDGQNMTTLLESQVFEGFATPYTYSTGVPSPLDDSFSVFTAQFSNRLFRNGGLINSASQSGKPVWFDDTAGDNEGLHLVFTAGSDYSENGTSFSRGFNIAEVNPQSGLLTSTLVPTLIPLHEYENWFIVSQDVNGDSIDEIVIAATRSESDYDNQTEIIVLNEQKQVVSQTVINGRATAIGERAYRSGSHNVLLALTNKDHRTERDQIASHLVSINALTGLLIWQSPGFTGETSEGSLHVIDSPSERHRVVSSTRNYVMVSR